MDKHTDILDINLARRIAELSAELEKEIYDEVFAYHLPDEDESSDEDDEIMDCLDANKESYLPESRHIYFDHENDDLSKPITGITVTDGIGNVLIDKDFDNPIDIRLEDEKEDR